MRRFLFSLLVATPLLAYEPPAGEKLTMLWAWSGRCAEKLPICAEEERRFRATMEVFYQVQSRANTSSVEFRRDGTLLVDRVPMKISAKQRAALEHALQAVRADLAGGTTWRQVARVLPAETYFLLAFPLRGDLHIVSGYKDSVRKEYLPLLNILQTYAEPEAVARLKPAASETAVLGYRVRHDLPDHLAVEIDYVYDGSMGAHVFVGANPVNETGVVMTGYRPNKIEKGRHTTCTVITTYAESPDEFTSDTLKIEFYVGGQGVFHDEYVPLRKSWRKSSNRDLHCCDGCTRGCGSLR